MAAYQDVRQRHVARLMAIMPGMIERLRWPVDRIRREREDRLRDLLRVVKERSPWHRERLRALDPATASSRASACRRRASACGSCSCSSARQRERCGASFRSPEPRAG
jgi:hypothetical protein